MFGISRLRACRVKGTDERSAIPANVPNTVVSLGFRGFLCP